MGSPVEGAHQPLQELHQRQEAAKHLLDTRGMRPLTNQEKEDIVQSFSQQLTMKDPTSLARIDMGIATDALPSLQEGRVLSVEIGGTNIYWAMVDISADGSTTIAKYSSVPFPRTEFGSPLDFFATVIGHITKDMEQTISETPYDAISVIYSYEHTNAPRRAGQPGLDAQPAIPMGKGFIVPSIDAIFVGEQLQDDLSIAYSENPPDSRLPYVVLNDAVAVLLSADAHIGGIVGTGVNFAIIVNGRIINLEAGNFDGVPIHAYAQQVDKISEIPGKHLAEKQVGGKYLGETLEKIVRDFSETGILPFGIKSDAALTAETITHVLDNNVQALSVVFDASEEQIRDNLPVLLEATTRLRARAAQITGCMIATVMRTYPHEFRDAPPIPMEGSVFWNVPGFKEWVKTTVEDITGQDVQFATKTHKSGIRGASKLVLRFRKRNR